ncbi:transposable element Tcb1 transposase [Trichonephila clavipes]|nr:transposable element Tcb1 transposase [Trichonephila clavipes]
MLYPRSNNWEVGGRPQCDKCGCRVRSCSQHVARLWRQFQTTGTAIRGFSSARPRGTPPADDRYIVLQARRNRRQTAEKSLDTRHRDWTTDITFYCVQKTARWWSVCTTPCTLCTFNACPSEKAFSVVPGTPELRERGSRNHPSNINEKGQIWRSRCSRLGGIMFGSRTDLQASSDAGSVNGPVIVTRFFFHMCVFREAAMGLCFFSWTTMHHYALHRTVAAFRNSS